MATAFLATFLAEAVLVIRLYALYNRSRKILVLMLLCYAASTSFTIWIMAQNMMAGSGSIAVLIPNGVTCTFPSLPPRAYGFWIPFTAFDSVLCAFAIYRGYQGFRSSVNLHGSVGNRLLKVMIRDSIFIFIILTLAYISGTLVWVKLLNADILIPGVFIAALSTVVPTRMILNIRDTASKLSHVGTTPSNCEFIEISVSPST
ncbi:hypothetical protein D9613_009877 [Agrocybe pediades]|uniref:Uncharacterized protein n=1 Tax=Agrocybe pediades TaxID=84607 RepID=A0A8H4QXN1_9AGAR|nr:hypothetical protein D9613_009877 [Agrocybe pediades]